jgi:hypothetical protein
MKQLVLIFFLALLASCGKETKETPGGSSANACSSGELTGSYRSGSALVNIANCSVAYSLGGCSVDAKFNTNEKTSGFADVVIMNKSAGCVIAASSAVCEFSLSGATLSLNCPALSINANFIKDGAKVSKTWGTP